MRSVLVVPVPVRPALDIHFLQYQLRRLDIYLDPGYHFFQPFQLMSVEVQGETTVNFADESLFCRLRSPLLAPGVPD